MVLEDIDPRVRQGPDGPCLCPSLFIYYIFSFLSFAIFSPLYFLSFCTTLLSPFPNVPVSILFYFFPFIFYFYSLFFFPSTFHYQRETDTPQISLKYFYEMENERKKNFFHKSVRSRRGKIKK